MMTLDQFRATGRDVADLGAELPGMDLEGRAGRVYVDKGGLFIERWDDHPSGPRWLLTLYSEQFDGELANLEEILFDFAKAEGWVQ